jgi:cytochrome d ubiquinol oxidase subunit II
VHFYDIPLVLVLIGLALYTVLGGADFGAGVWQLLAGTGPDSQRIRDHAHHAMGPVWEANHVWILFVITVSWTAYPLAFGSIFSTLSVALFLAGLGIILRGAAYALRSGASSPSEYRAIDLLFAVSSVITPFALGAAVGGVASRRVPVGNAAGDLFSSWLNPTSILVGVLAVVLSAYVAAVYLSADSMRLGERDLEDYFRVRALATGVVAGAIAIGGLFVIRSDARALYDGLLSGDGLPALIVSALGGVATLALVWRRRYEPARYSAGVAVAAIIAGWALAQQPLVLPGLTVQQAAAPHDTLVAVTIAVVAGAVILLPSLALLFGLYLRGGFDRELPEEAVQHPPSGREVLSALRPGLLMRLAVAAFIAGIGFLNVADAGWAHGVGVVCLLAFVVLGFRAIAFNLLGSRPRSGEAENVARDTTMS